MFEGESFEGDLGPLDTASTSIVARTRSEDVGLAPREDTPPPGTVGLPATVVDSELGGRYMDVVVEVGLTRLQARVPAGERGGWARSLNAGQQVLASLRTGDVAFYDDSGALIGRTGRPAVVAG